jgi:hypothetical protein
MSTELHFVARSTLANKIIRIVGDLSPIARDSWLLHSCYLNSMNTETNNEIAVRQLEAELDNYDSPSKWINIRDLATNLEGVHSVTVFTGPSILEIRICC